MGRGRDDGRVGEYGLRSTHGGGGEYDNLGFIAQPSHRPDEDRRHSSGDGLGEESFSPLNSSFLKPHGASGGLFGLGSLTAEQRKEWADSLSKVGMKFFFLRLKWIKEKFYFQDLTVNSTTTLFTP